MKLDSNSAGQFEGERYPFASPKRDGKDEQPVPGQFEGELVPRLGNLRKEEDEIHIQKAFDRMKRHALKMLRGGGRIRIVLSDGLQLEVLWEIDSVKERRHF